MNKKRNPFDEEFKKYLNVFRKKLLLSSNARIFFNNLRKELENVNIEDITVITITGNIKKKL